MRSSRTPNPGPGGSRTFVGPLAAAGTIVLWSTFALSVRAIGGTSLTSADAALLRFATPLLVLAPFVPRALRAVRRERPLTVLAVCCGAGLPHYLLSSAGGARTSAVLVGVVVPGTAPLFVAVIGLLWWRLRISRVQAGALALVVAGVAVAVGQATDSRQAGGIAALVAAGLSWAVYTCALRGSALRPLDVVVVVAAANTVVDAVAIASGLLPSTLRDGSAAAGDVVTFVLLQGICVGVFSVLCYATAVRRLGGPVAATSGATSPVLTLLLAAPLFGEPVTTGTVLVLGLVLTGVAAFNLDQVRRTRLGSAPAAARPDPVPVLSGGASSC